MELFQLTNTNRLLAKEVSFSVDEGYSLNAYSNALWFDASIQKVSDIDVLLALLRELQGNPHAMLIRGKPREECDITTKVRRRKYIAEDEPNSRPFHDQPLHWVMLDIDKLPLPNHIDLIASPEDAVRFAIEQLPKEFHVASVFWHLSSSAGIKSIGTVSIHLHYWLSDAKTSFELREWGKAFNAVNGKNLIDTALFNPVQPHYTADPVFVGGAVDPLKGKRSGFIRGKTDEVRLVRITLPPVVRTETSSSSLTSRTYGYEQILSELGDDKGRFHLPLRNSIASFVAKVGGEEATTQREWLKADLRERIAKANSSDHDAQTLERYKSDEYLDGLITGAIEKYGDRAKLPPHFDSHELSLEDAQLKLEKTIQEFGEKVKSWHSEEIHGADEPPTIAIRATAGLGKTTQIIEKLIQATAIDMGDVHYYAPTHTLLKQLEGDLNEALTISTPSFDLLRVNVIAGRDRKDDEGNPLCLKSDLARQIGAAGLNVSTTLCKSGRRQCEYFDSCGYQKQFPDKEAVKEAKRSSSSFQSPWLNEVQCLTHSHLYLNSKSRLPDPKLIVIDESFWRGAVEEVLIAPTDLSRSGSPLAKLVYEALVQPSPQPLLRTLRERGVTPDQLREEADTVEGQLEVDNKLNPSMSETAVKDVLSKRSDAIKTPQVLRQLADELEAVQRDESHSVRYEPKEVKTAGEKKDRIILSRRKPFLIPHNVPVIFIDANANLDILKLFREHVEVVEIPVQRKATIHQFTDRTFSKTSLDVQNKESALRGQVVKFIERIGQNGKTLVVATKAVKDALQAAVDMPRGMLGGDMVSFIHFGNLRGLNDYGSYDNVIVVGREQPAANGMEDQARALWWDAEMPIYSLPIKDGNKPLPEAYRGYRGGSHAPVKVQVHPDSRVQALLEQAREAESEQALDRLRLLREPTGKPRNVYILSKLPLDVTVDHHYGWDTFHNLLSLWEEAEGILPLKPADMLRRCPNSLKSEEAAKERREDWKKVLPLIETFIREDTFFYRRYRPKNSRSKWSEVVCSGQVSEEQLGQILLKVTGNNVVFIDKK